MFENLDLQKRPSRSKSDAPDVRAGYRTLRRGDQVMYKDLHNSRPLEETVYGVMVFDHRGQQRRQVITYNASAQCFSIAAWTSWRLW